jgi:hypothetical protein
MVPPRPWRCFPTVSGNGTGLASAGGAQLDTYKNNSVNGNTTDGTFTTQITPQ